MLRTQGFPARVAAGFFGGERINDKYVVRAGDAHAWAQVWVPRRGFVSVDATPPSNRSGQPSPLFEWVVRAYERVEGFWRARVLDYSIQDQYDLARALVQPPRDTGPRGATALPPRDVWIALAGAGMLGYAVWRLRKRWRGQAPRHPASALLDAIDRALETAGVGRRPGEPLEELSARLLAENHPLASPVQSVTRRYLEARFGGRPLEPGERERLIARLAPVERARAA